MCAKHHGTTGAVCTSYLTNPAPFDGSVADTEIRLQVELQLQN